MAETERPEFTDEVEIVLQRAAPGAVEKIELEEETQLPSEALRSAIEWLEGNGEIRSTDDGFIWGNGNGEGPAETLSEGAPSEPSIAEDGQVVGPALAAHVRAGFEVTCSFGRKPGDSDAAAIQKAQSIATEMGNALARALPKLAFDVQVKKVDAFDNPRPIWPAENDE